MTNRNNNNYERDIVKLYYKEIMKLMIQKKADGNNDYIDKLTLDTKFIEVLISMSFISDGYIDDKCKDIIESIDTKNLSDKDSILNIFKNQYTLLRYIITESSIKGKNELVYKYIEKVFSTLFICMSNSVK